MYSKDIVRYLNSMGFPLGRKKDFKIIIPKEIKNNELFARAFIRGMLDTDGCVVPQRKTNMILDICIMNSDLMGIMKEVCDKVDVNFSYSKNRVYLCTVKKVKDFFSKIGSSNLRNIIRFDHHMKKGYSIRASEIERFLTEYSKVKLPYYLGL